MTTFIHFWLFIALTLLPAHGQGLLSLAGSPPAEVVAVSPGTGSLVSWFDFATNANDLHSTKHFTTEGSPAFTAGSPSYVTFGAGKRAYNISGLQTAFNNAAGDCAFVIRWRGFTSLSNGSTAISGSRFFVNYYASGGIQGGLSNGAKTSATVGALDTWYTTIYSWDEATDTLSESTNGSTFATVSVGAPDYGTGTIYLSQYLNMEIDFAGFYTKQLTQANVAWLYNSNGTRIYGDL